MSWTMAMPLRLGLKRQYQVNVRAGNIYRSLYMHNQLRLDFCVRSFASSSSDSGNGDNGAAGNGISDATEDKLEKRPRVMRRVGSGIFRDIFPNNRKLQMEKQLKLEKLQKEMERLQQEQVQEQEQGPEQEQEQGQEQSTVEDGGGSAKPLHSHYLEMGDESVGALYADHPLDESTGILKKGLQEISSPYDRRSELFPTDSLRVLSHTRESERAKHDRLTGYRVFRSMAPYIAVHRDSVMVIHIPGEVLESELVDTVMNDIVLLKTLGVKPVIVAGCRPQIRKRLIEYGVRSFFVQGNRVCDLETLKHCMSVAGHVRVDIEAKLGRGLMNAPSGTGVNTVQVISGNFVKSIPFGVRGGIDFKYTGIVQRLNAKRILSLLDQGDIVLLGHLGYSPSSHVFHCRSEEVAVKAATELKAEKLVFFHNGESVVDVSRGREGGAVVHNLSLKVAERFSDKLMKELGETDGRVRHSDADPMTEWKRQFLDYILCAIKAVSSGVSRVHMVSRHIEGSIISELCTRDGMGIMVSYDLYDGVRKASIRDVQAIIDLIHPLEKQGILVTRPPEQIEMEIERFFVFERDGDVLACFQMVHFEDPRYENGCVEMSCVAVSPALQREGIGNALLSYCLRKAVKEGIHNVFVLTTRSSHWFMDRGFQERPPEALPPKKYATYDHRRNPKVYFKKVEDDKHIDQEEIMWLKAQPKMNASAS